MELANFIVLLYYCNYSNQAGSGHCSGILSMPVSCSATVRSDGTASCMYPPDNRPWPDSIKTLPCRATWNSLQPGHLQHLQTSPDRQGQRADSMCTAFSHLFFNILFDSINHSHVHTYISCWGPEEQSPSLEINFDSTNLACLYPAHSAGRGTHSMKEVETGEPTQSLSSLPSPCPGTRMCYWPSCPLRGPAVSRITLCLCRL